MAGGERSTAEGGRNQADESPASRGAPLTPRPSSPSLSRCASSTSSKGTTRPASSRPAERTASIGEVTVLVDDDADAPTLPLSTPRDSEASAHPSPASTRPPPLRRPSCKALSRARARRTSAATSATGGHSPPPSYSCGSLTEESSGQDVSSGRDMSSRTEEPRPDDASSNLSWLGFFDEALAEASAATREARAEAASMAPSMASEASEASEDVAGAAEAASGLEAARIQAMPRPSSQRQSRCTSRTHMGLASCMKCTCCTCACACTSHSSLHLWLQPVTLFQNTAPAEPVVIAASRQR